MLKEKGIRTGIATSNDRKLVEEFLKARQITYLFDTICTSCEVNKGKPAPEHLQIPGRQKALHPAAQPPSDKHPVPVSLYSLHSYEDITNQTYEVL